MINGMDIGQLQDQLKQEDMLKIDYIQDLLHRRMESRISKAHCHKSW